MAARTLEAREAVVPSDDDKQIAKESIRKLARFRGSRAQPRSVGVHIQPDEGDEEVVVIPTAAFLLLSDILTEMARGNAITLIPIHAELTTQQAADVLNVSRPFLIGLLESNAIPYRKVGSHRRILFKDLMAYKRNADSERREALKQITAESEELGLY
jgi:excisionase family DNA binding protein